MKNIHKIIALITSLFLSSCQTQNPPLPEIVPAVEVKQTPKHVLGIIGEVEPIYMLPMKAPIVARIDTGATTSSIDADNITPFERDGWNSFSVALQTRKEQSSGTRMKGEINPEMDKIVKRSQGLR